jgi:predicted dienelactone hydrolase
MKHKSFKIVLITSFFISTTLYAQTGLSKLAFKDQSRNRQIDAFVFYPTNSKPDSTYADNRVYRGFKAKKDSPISDGKYPLYILVHGTSGNWKNLSWLAKVLSQEAIVVSANYPSYTTGQASPESVLKPWDQPKDVSFIITQMLEGKYRNHIDSSKIAVIGHSLGGYTAMAVLGAIIDLSKYVEFCSRETDKSCQYFNKALTQVTQENILLAKQHLYDERVRASIALAPGFVESMTEQSLEALKKPMLIISAGKDENVPSETHLSNIPEHIQRYEIAGASHFSFMQICKPGAIKILVEENAAFACEDGSRKDRNEIHREVIRQVKLFLSKSGM